MKHVLIDAKTIIIHNQLLVLIYHLFDGFRVLLFIF